MGLRESGSESAGGRGCSSLRGHDVGRGTGGKVEILGELRLKVVEGRHLAVRFAVEEVETRGVVGELRLKIFEERHLAVKFAVEEVGTWENYS